MVRYKNRFFILLVKAKDGRAYDSIGATLLGAIRNSVELHHGPEALKAALGKMAVLHYNHLACVAIVRAARSEYQRILASCLKVHQVDYKGVTVKLLKHTGVLRVAKREAGEHIQRLLAGQHLNKQQQEVAAALLERLAAVY